MASPSQEVEYQNSTSETQPIQNKDVPHARDSQTEHQNKIEPSFDHNIVDLAHAFIQTPISDPVHPVLYVDMSPTMCPTLPMSGHHMVILQAATYPYHVAATYPLDNVPFINLHGGSRILRTRGGGEKDDEKDFPTWDGKRGVSWEATKRLLKVKSSRISSGTDTDNMWDVFMGTDQGGDNIAGGAPPLPAPRGGPGGSGGRETAQRYRNRRQSKGWSLLCEVPPAGSDLQTLLMDLATGDQAIAGQQHHFTYGAEHDVSPRRAWSAR